MFDKTMTLTTLETICRQAAASQKTGVEDFRPTTNQVYFFTLVWLSKKNKTGQTVEELLAGQDMTTLSERTRQVAYQLGEWGAMVARLKQKDDREWELLRLQLEKAVRYQPYSSEESRAEALQNALVKIFQLLDKMPTWQEVETTEVATFVLNTRTKFTNLYDFGSPFYAYAKRLAQNELVTQFRTEGRRSHYPLLEDSLGPSEWVLPPSSSFGEDDETSVQALRLQLKAHLADLLNTIQHALTPKPTQVILQTLGSRDGFWRALEEVGLAAPPGLSPVCNLTTDADIAQALGMTENNVRVHRAHGKKLVAEVDPCLGFLLESLITRHGKITYRPSTN